MQFRTLLLGSFIEKTNLDNFLQLLDKNHNIKKEKTHLYDLDEQTYLLTYKLNVDIGENFDIKRHLPKTIQLHKKNYTFFTINALNQLIEHDSDLPKGNIDFKNYKIDWSKYEDNLILISGGELIIYKIKRIFFSNM